MFGLPTSTTLILAAVIAFWVVYTLVFYFSTSNWSKEDADYGPTTSEDEAGAGPGSPRITGGEPR